VAQEPVIRLIQIKPTQSVPRCSQATNPTWVCRRARRLRPGHGALSAEAAVDVAKGPIDDGGFGPVLS
jgi:hypothetical protein